VSTMNALAIIMAGGRGTRLGVLSQKRAKSAMPFAGKYRLIDFALSNCANSDITNVGVLTQHQPDSLHHHVHAGWTWGPDRKLSGGVTLLPSDQRNGGALDWYRGTADAVYKNLDFILRHEPDAVLVLSSDHVYKMDYTPFIRYHQQRRADVTICAIDVPLKEASRFGILVTGSDGRVVEFQEKPRRPRSPLASMGIYVFRTDVLAQCLTQDACDPDSDHDFGRDVLPRMLALGDRLYAYRFEGYWKDLGTVQAYWQAHMDLLSPDPPLNLLDPHWSIYTRCEGRPPASIRPGAAISCSIIADGCAIEGQVEGSVLSPGVRIRVGAVVRNSVVLDDCDVGEGAIVEQAILDKNVVVGRGGWVGLDLDDVMDGYRFDEINDAITVVGKNTRLPAGICVSRGCAVDGDLAEDDFAADLIVSRRDTDLQPIDSIFVPPRHIPAIAPAFC
jgi:glucose-1-phosphate adenylyltransferase